ncbi:hypothetical protein I4F81_012398 [Pyropia yezoensis]|uniref:Uncharacterized protein n=1 Tax=Pyropia yezoensis TaxID=2788 RepID=A0ACC3CIJ8_PYRYE|nr:hypothetical protein I4F81_012398 [Neopyropia yezoensis]
MPTNRGHPPSRGLRTRASGARPPTRDSFVSSTKGWTTRVGHRLTMASRRRYRQGGRPAGAAAGRKQKRQEQEQAPTPGPGWGPGGQRQPAARGEAARVDRWKNRARERGRQNRPAEPVDRRRHARPRPRRGWRARRDGRRSRGSPLPAEHIQGPTRPAANVNSVDAHAPRPNHPMAWGAEGAGRGVTSGAATTRSRPTPPGGPRGGGRAAAAAPAPGSAQRWTAAAPSAPPARGRSGRQRGGAARHGPPPCCCCHRGSHRRPGRPRGPPPLGGLPAAPAPHTRSLWRRTTPPTPGNPAPAGTPPPTVRPPLGPARAAPAPNSRRARWPHRWSRTPPPPPPRRTAPPPRCTATGSRCGRERRPTRRRPPPPLP